MRLSGEGASVAVEGVTALLRGGRFRIYTGERPSSAASPLRGNMMLVELRFRGTAFHRADEGVAEAYSLEDGEATATGNATFFRALTEDGVTVVFDGSVGTRAADLVVNSTLIQEGATVSVPEMRITAPKGA